MLFFRFVHRLVGAGRNVTWSVCQVPKSLRIICFETKRFVFHVVAILCFFCFVCVSTTTNSGSIIWKDMILLLHDGILCTFLNTSHGNLGSCQGFVPRRLPIFLNDTNNQ